jgi:hypothetical protein
MSARCSSCTLAIAALFVILSPSRAQACAGCRNPTLATSRISEGPLDDGALRVGATVTATTTRVVHRAGCADVNACAEVPVQPLYLHDQRLWPVELRLVGEYSLGHLFGVEIQAPFRLVHTSIEYTTLESEPYEPLDAGVHHRNETLAGVADPLLLLRVGGFVERWWLATRAGVSVPLGRTEPNPFELGDQGLRHQHIQFGTGTVDPIGMVEASRSLDGFEVDFFAQGQLSLYENEHGYRAPLRLSGGGSFGARLFGDFEGALGVEGYHEGAERWDGVIRQDAALGRTEVLAAVLATQGLGRTTLNLGLRFPLYRHIVTGDDPSGDLSSPVTLSVGVTHVFGGRAEP